MTDEFACVENLMDGDLQKDWYENGESDYLIVGDGVLLAYKGEEEDFVLPANVKYVACETP